MVWDREYLYTDQLNRIQTYCPRYRYGPDNQNTDNSLHIVLAPREYKGWKWKTIYCWDFNPVTHESIFRPWTKSIIRGKRVFNQWFHIGHIAATIFQLVYFWLLWLRKAYKEPTTEYHIFCSFFRNRLFWEGVIKLKRNI